MGKKVLVILTSHGKLGATDKPTGWYLPEFAHPYDVFVKAGLELTVASPLGGHAPLDPASVEASKDDASSQAFLEQQTALWEKTAPLKDFVGRADQFDAVFVPGGHGPMFDLATDATSQAVLAEFADKGKVVAAVCHGPAALVGVRLPSTGELLVRGRRVTGFTNAEEDQVGLSNVMPFLLETRLNEASGGKFVKSAEPWGVKVVEDGRLITGQNPASAKALGEALVKALS
ncbi:hypothetical protein P8C59_005041 [Phyllachora maydis]|uniref:D-lactate dehydratase n=1 Tax=Phyllachora maydis TaxID=1825666 RepID=A0AAD9I3W6_9PEZI|nr:hypothetical protein P8C59_005041 [Phyllachora maydis]